MSPRGALILALATLILLGAFAAWLMNVPIWAVAILVVIAAWIAKWALRRFSHGRARQETERAP